MNALVEFPQGQGSVYVNPALITHIKSSGPNITYIHFDHENHIVVNMDSASVVTTLQSTQLLR